MLDAEESNTQDSGGVVIKQQLARKQEWKAVALAMVAGKIGQGGFAAAVPSVRNKR